MKQVVIGLLGYGTVGSGVSAIIRTNRYDIHCRTNSDITIKKALVRNLLKERPYSDNIIFTDDPLAILHDPEIDIVVEVMGGIEPARSYILEALKQGKNVVTANKDLLASYGMSFGGCGAQ